MKNRFKKTKSSLATVYLLLLAANGNAGETAKASADSTWRHGDKAPKTQLVSVNRAGTDSGNGYSRPYDVSLSANGRFVAFSSYASDLVVNDANGLLDLFVRDLKTGKTALVTINLAGVSSNYDPGEMEDIAIQTPNVSLSADGRFAAFHLYASDLVANKNGGSFVRDLKAGKTTWVSRGNFPELSENGRFVLYQIGPQFYVRDLKTGTTTLVTINLAGKMSNPIPDITHDYSIRKLISANGRVVVFESDAGDLVPNDTNGDTDEDVYNGRARDTFVRDLKTGKTTLLSGNRAGMALGFYAVSDASLSANGRFVAFSSPASDLVANDSNNTRDLFVRDLKTGTTTLVSVNRTGTASGNSFSHSPKISSDGRFVLFFSKASDLVSNDNNNADDLFIRDQSTGTTALVSVNRAGKASGIFVSPYGEIYPAALSADGRIAAFSSAASNLVANDTNGQVDMFVRDLKSGTTTLISVNRIGTAGGKDGGSGFPALSSDGKILAFASSASDLVENDTNSTTDIFVRPTRLEHGKRKHQHGQ